jgi:1-acyl-sn-glycerol-3-phosphate acyltransferase
MKYEKWSFGYCIYKLYIRFVDWVIHKKVVTVGKENIPDNKPILFAPNHQNALSDPLAILLYTKYQPVWLARADIFKPGIITTLLRFCKIMPVYRIRDGKDQLSKNDKTFADSIKVLKNNFPLALFPEAAHSKKRQMMPHKKAVPRIVFMAEEKANENLDIHIVPTGIYYSSYWKFNRSVVVNFGKPVLVNDFLDEYKVNPNNATAQLREALYKAIDPLIINIRSEKHYSAFDLIREIYGKTFLKASGGKFSLVNLFKSDQILTQKLDKLEADDSEKAEKLCGEAVAYNKAVHKHKLRNWLVTNPENNFLKTILNVIVLLITLPVFVYGFIFNAIPFFGIDIFVRKKVKDWSFWSSFSEVLGMAVFPVVYLLEMLAVSPFLPCGWCKLLFFISLPLLGKIAFRWYVLCLKTLGRIRLLTMKKNGLENIEGTTSRTF